MFDQPTEPVRIVLITEKLSSELFQWCQYDGRAIFDSLSGVYAND
jgi:hypothetical protein